MRSIVWAWTLAGTLALAVAMPQLAWAAPTSDTPNVTAAPTEADAEVAAEADLGAAAEPEALEVVATSHGQASFYAKRFHGRRTASGEPHDAEALTAAHRSLPFGTWVRVQSLRSGQQVTVRINDRGPFTRGRVIDLSRAAAEALGMLQAGTHAVQLQVLGLSKP